MKTRRPRPSLLPSLAALFGLFTAAAAPAETVGHWRFEDANAADGDPIPAAPSEVNSPALDATPTGSPVYTTDLPGTTVTDPVTGDSWPNATAFDASAGSTRFNVPDDALLNSEDFTVEFFIKLGGEPGGYHSFVRRRESNMRRWQIDFDHGGGSGNFGRIRSRWDTPDGDTNNVAHGTTIYVDTASGSGDTADYTAGDVATEGNGFNDDEGWHHVALTFTTATKTVTLFTDYEENTTKTLNGTFAHPSGVIQMGKLSGDTYALAIDEVRYSSRILLPSEFLTASIDETDADEDLLRDEWEVEHFGDIAAQDGDGDPDGDALSNFREQALGLDPNVGDTDGDGILDGREVDELGTRADLPDTDFDGLTDREEDEEHGTDPVLRDTDGDGVSDRGELLAGTDPTNGDSTPGPLLRTGGVWVVRHAGGAGNVRNLQNVDALFDGTVTPGTETVTFHDGIDFDDNNAGRRVPGSEPFPNQDAAPTDHAILATARIFVQIPGTYTFNSHSDDGSRLRIDGEDVWVDNSGHGTRDGFSTAFLDIGFHDVEYVWWSGTGGYSVELSVATELGEFTDINHATWQLLPASSEQVEDTDADGLDDAWERFQFGDLSAAAADDPDEDGLDNLGEFRAGTGPGTPDTDGDGLTDGDEVLVHGTDPRSQDTDGDGLNDDAEIGSDPPTDPLQADSDGDGFGDGDEVASGSDPNDPLSDPSPFVRGGRWEIEHAKGEAAFAADLDGSWLAPVEALFNDGTNRLDVSGTPGAVNPSRTLHRAVNFHVGTGFGNFGDEEAFPNIALGADNFALRARGKIFLREAATITFGMTGDDGGRLRIDGETVIDDDSTHPIEDHLGSADLAAGLHEVEMIWFEAAGGESIELYAAREAGSFGLFTEATFDLLQPADPHRLPEGDGDGDGMDDFWETFYFGDLTADGTGDGDADGLDDAGEFAQRTHPAFADTDTDGLADGAEVAAGSDPHAPDSDGDGLTDGDEVTAHGTSPVLADTDGDGASDSFELAFGTDPTLADDSPPAGGVFLVSSVLSWNDPAAWSDGLAPTADKDYFVLASLADTLRAPPGLAPVFGGRSLTFLAEPATLLLGGSDGTVVTVPHLVLNQTTVVSSRPDTAIVLDGEVEFAGPVTIDLTAGGQTIELRARLTGPGAVEILGGEGSSLVLRGEGSTFTGSWTVDGGALRALAPLSLGVGDVTFTNADLEIAYNLSNPGATLSFNGDMSRLVLDHELGFSTFLAGGGSLLGGQRSPWSVFAELGIGPNVVSGDYSDPTFNGTIPAGALIVGGDADADGLDDEWEIALFGDTATADGAGDPDGDGLDNRYEYAVGSDPTAGDGEVDSDGDGISDAAEAAAGTDPRDAFSRLAVRAPSRDPETGAFTLAWQSVMGITYQPEVAADPAGPWAPLGDPVTAAGVESSVADPDAGAADERFYRVVVVVEVP